MKTGYICKKKKKKKKKKKNRNTKETIRSRYRH
jgi:hypothetical protein